MSKVPRPPKRLDTAGRALWRDVVKVYELTDLELRLLTEVCATADVIDQLDAVVAEEGVVTVGSRDQRVTHPAVTELRMQRVTFGRLLGQLALPDPDGGVVRTAQQLRAQRAGQARWRARDRRRAAGGVG